MSARLEVADIFRRHGEAYRQVHDGHLGRVERRVMSAIELCRTAELGGHVEGCRSCGAIRVAYNSCRNRHCPKGQGQACRDWLAAREAELPGPAMASRVAGNRHSRTASPLPFHYNPHSASSARGSVQSGLQ
jgi:hypothetical protein